MQKTRKKNPRTDADRYANNGRVAGALTTSNRLGSHMISMMCVDNDRPRKLTPLECERLMGFPDGYTSDFSDTQRYRMLGNSMPVPVISWIGKRILESEPQPEGCETKGETL
jgi:DNA (cytosine-5)-methyltransferase 1